jgi:MFS family permease
MGLFAPSKITTMDEARAHRKYALFVLMIVYAFNFIDRQILNILQEPIKHELHLSDTQLGLLTGFSFTLVYITVGIAVGRLADATSRKTVVGASLAIWSGFTALSGLATSYWSLLAARLGVGVGEAGGSPPAHAMISDLYEPDRRARALAIYSAGIYIGTMLGNVAGGWLSETFSWREAFFVVGLPGVALAILMQMTLREPVRGLSGIAISKERTTFVQAFKHLWSLKAFRYYSIATGAGTFVTYGIGNWMAPFLARTYNEWSIPGFQQMLGRCSTDTFQACVQMDRTEIGLFYGITAGVFGAIGTIGGGYVADRLGKKDKRWFLWVPMWGKLIGGPIFLAGLLAPTAELALLGYAGGIVLASAYLGPSLAITHSLVPPSMRSMSSAVLFFILNLLGLGLGPLIVGNISDYLLANTDLGADSLRWAMACSVFLTYPLCLLWHLGARQLPKDNTGDASAEALTLGDAQPSAKA